MKEVDFLTSLDQFPVYGCIKHDSRVEIIGYNAAEYYGPNNYVVERSFMKMDIKIVSDSRFEENPENVDGFYVKLTNEDHFMTEVITFSC